jgi:hypothetical protein
MKMFRVIAVAALTLAAGSTFAHKGMHGPGAKFDVDGSEDLSLAEYIEYLKSEKEDVTKAADKFAKLDQDKNGALSSAEFLAGLAQGAAKSGQ